ncbi:MAG: hypothetical protein AAFP03_13480 [Cyanobacteria bacterium J06598_3]
MAGMLSLTLGACTISEVSMPDGVAPGASDAPTSNLPAVRLPSIRLSSRSTVTIDSLAADKANDSVSVEGRVVQTVGILEGSLYQVQDDTGSLWVLSDRTGPEVDQRVTVAGVVRYEAIVVGEIDAGDVYLEEKDYRQHDGQNESQSDGQNDRPRDQ